MINFDEDQWSHFARTPIKGEPVVSPIVLTVQKTINQWLSLRLISQGLRTAMITEKAMTVTLSSVRSLN
ncbi:hypothetical protein SAMN06265368_2877 [Cohaesibacter gelatinilyticus]|uniref:Uncharacterized protein n=1 Tax=Cohaesibacter gelatinilyticus TaxID=372072 RepID=A0A285PDF6_9HYPH|nr:hypothetical protein SAMN06265368_2877 [Cohaesibacter gelatinilyticus]